MKLPMQPRNLLTALFGIFMIVAAVYGYIIAGAQLSTLRETAAVVVEVVAYETGTMQKARMHPTVRFTSADGREVTGRTEKHLKVKPGDPVRILYDPAAPERIEVRTLAQAHRQRALFSGLAIAFGLALSLGAIAVDRGLIRLPESAAPTRVYKKR
jgi:hypothetical protein